MQSLTQCTSTIIAPLWWIKPYHLENVSGLNTEGNIIWGSNSILLFWLNLLSLQLFVCVFNIRGNKNANREYRTHASRVFQVDCAAEGAGIICLKTCNC